MRGLRLGDESEVRMCFVVIWKNIGVFLRDSSGSESRGSFLVLPAATDCSAEDFKCFISAFSAFVNFR